MLKNSKSKYGNLTKLFHWVFAALIFFQFYTAMWREYVLGKNTPEGLYYIKDLHKPFGVLILFLLVFRVIWRMINERVTPEESLPAWENKAAHSVHMLLYLFMLAMPVTGIFMSHFAGYSVSFFGLFDLPNFLEKSKTWGSFFHGTHAYLSYAMFFILLAHIGAALRHHFILKNKVLKRML